MHLRHQTITAVLVALGLSLAGSKPAMAQVVIEMPPPPKRAAPSAPMVMPTPASAPSSATTVSTSSSSIMVAYPVSTEPPPDVGDVALWRYSSARRGTHDTYFNDGTYWNGGVRVYSYPRYYPQWVWGPWYGGLWPGWPFWNGCW